jgi:hypothetical protein
MPEQYQVAAYRHFETAELLAEHGKIDDAAYHLGISGENSIKYAMQDCGLEAHWNSARIPKNSQPMRGHWGKLQAKINNELAIINLYATGRRSASLRNIVNNGVGSKFNGWNIDIRYADSGLVPVSQADHDQWHNDAEEFLINFVL